MFEAFGERDYRRFWFTQFLSNVGSWMQTVAQGFLVYRLSDSPFLLGFVGFANAVPAVFLMLFGGVLADHFDRRRVVALSQWAQGLSALALAISIHAGRITVWQIVAASVVSGIAISFSAPAWQAMVLDLLDDRSRLANAVAMNSLQFQLSRAVGPLLAAVALSAFGAFWCFFLNAVSFLPLIFVLGRVRPRQAASSSEIGPIWPRMREGFRYVMSARMILLALCVAAAASLFGFPYLQLLPVLARQLFGAEEARWLGYLTAAVGAGALTGSLTLSVKTPPRDWMLPAIVACLALFGLTLAGIGYLPWRSVVMVMLYLCGVVMVVCLALCNTTIQQRVPDQMRGRVMSMYTYAFYAVVPFGSLAAGVLCERLGIGLTLVILGAALTLCAAAAGIAVRRRNRGRTMTGEVKVPGTDVDADWH